MKEFLHRIKSIIQCVLYVIGIILAFAIIILFTEIGRKKDDKINNH